MKKLPSEVAYNRPIFFNTGPAAQTAQSRNPVPPKAPQCRTGQLDWAYTLRDKDVFKTCMGRYME